MKYHVWDNCEDFATRAEPDIIEAINVERAAEQFMRSNADDTGDFDVWVAIPGEEDSAALVACECEVEDIRVSADIVEDADLIERTKNRGEAARENTKRLKETVSRMRADGTLPA